ncbi:MAG: hypothetical protein HY646_00125, partial [Acidobacteria bacterium]|nr:hypothetical protein [Acidobacteriota bacterium]
MFSAIPPRQGLYDPQFEHDSCGVGFVADIAGRRSNSIVRQSLRVLINMLHRGAKGCEANTGDGAGILLQIPHEFLKEECQELGFALPSPGHYGAAMAALPRDPHTQRWCEQVIEAAIDRQGLTLLGWRTVPTNNQSLGD